MYYFNDNVIFIRNGGNNRKLCIVVHLGLVDFLGFLDVLDASDLLDWWDVLDSPPPSVSCVGCGYSSARSSGDPAIAVIVSSSILFGVIISSASFTLTIWPNIEDPTIPTTASLLGSYRMVCTTLMLPDVVQVIMLLNGFCLMNSIRPCLWRILLNPDKNLW
jgi:hypothetical protein